MSDRLPEFHVIELIRLPRGKYLTQNICIRHIGRHLDRLWSDMRDRDHTIIDGIDVITGTRVYWIAGDHEDHHCTVIWWRKNT